MAKRSTAVKDDPKKTATPDTDQPPANTESAGEKKPAASQPSSAITSRSNGFPASLETRNEDGSLDIYCRTPKPRGLIVNDQQVVFPASHSVTVPDGHIGVLLGDSKLSASRVHLVGPLMLLPGEHALEVELENRRGGAFRFECLGVDSEDKAKAVPKVWFRAARLYLLKTAAVAL